MPLESCLQSPAELELQSVRGFRNYDDKPHSRRFFQCGVRHIEKAVSFRPVTVLSDALRNHSVLQELQRAGMMS
jgi:hypothetical protein